MVILFHDGLLARRLRELPVHVEVATTREARGGHEPRGADEPAPDPARLEQLSEDLLRLNEGTVYASLLRLQQQGWIRSEWGTSEANRKARFYSITKAGRRQLAHETESWEKIAGVITRVLRLEGER